MESRNDGHAPSKTDCLISMGVGRNNGRHEANSSFHALSKVSGIFCVTTMLIVGEDTSINDTQYHDSILEASQEILCGQIMKKVASSWKELSMFPYGDEDIVQSRTFVVMGVRVRFVFAHLPYYEISVLYT